MVHIYYSEHRTTNVEHFEMVNDHDNCKGMPTQRKPTPPFPPTKETR